MEPINWQAVLDGSLEGKELVQAEQRLVTDEVAQAERDGLAAFIQETQTQLMEVEVPTEQIWARFSLSLESLEAPVEEAPVAEHKAPAFMAYLWLAPLAAAALVAVLLPRPTPVSPQEVAKMIGELHQGPVLNTYEGNALTAAMQNVRAVQPNAPYLDLLQDGSVVRSRRGRDWACVDYKVQGAEFCVSVQPLPKFFDNLEPVGKCLRHKDLGMGIRHNKIGIWISGGTDAQRQKLAQELEARLERGEPEKMRSVEPSRF